MAEPFPGDHGVIITSDMATFKDGSMYFEVLKEPERGHTDSTQKELLLYVRNTNDNSVYLNGYTLVPETTVFIIKDLGISPGRPFKIASGKQCEIWLLGRFPQPDVFSAELVFHFNSNGGPLSIVCPIKVCYKSEKNPSKKTSKRTAQGTYLRPVIHRLEEYPLPARFKEIVTDLNDVGSSSENKAMLEEELSMKQYSQRFALLLHLEEYAQLMDKRNCSMDTLLTRSGELFCLKVDRIRQIGLCCLPGDRVRIRPQSSTTTFYQAHVHDVNGDEVALQFSKGLGKLYRKDMHFTVEFTVNRLTLRIQHRAVQQAGRYGMGRVLFPTEATRRAGPAKLKELRLFDQTLNEEQYKAVKHIVAGSSKPAPYLVFGPPGTGKTVTLVEAIKQVDQCQDSCHILACASTNCAADLLCAMIKSPKVYRLYALSQDGIINQELVEPLQCNRGKDGIFIPSIEELRKHKIMVTTLFTAARLIRESLPLGFYTHIFVDEAGQPCEPEAVIPLAGLLDPRHGQVVLAGDPKQLGPIVSSCLAKRHGLGVSLLERLMALKKYKKNVRAGYNERFITKLLRNYRNHGDILEIPNELFYEKEVQVCADPCVRNALLDWRHLPTKGFPLIFHEVAGRMRREDSGTSLFNMLEVDILMGYLKELLDHVPPGDIGIMAPYRKQVERIEEAVRSKFPGHMAEIKFGTVEEFQGGQKPVILLSTVRANTKSVCLGFVNDPKRFNVAMTRAQALLIVAGNSRALATNGTWRRFIEYCKERGGYTDTMHMDEGKTMLMIEKLHI